jgi:hypothetical protein
MKEIRKQKKKKKEKKILAERTNPAQPALLTRCPARQILGAAQPAVSPRVRARPPCFSFIFSIFQNLSPLKHEYLKIYNTFFGSVCFCTLLT